MTIIQNHTFFRNLDNFVLNTFSNISENRENCEIYLWLIKIISLDIKIGINLDMFMLSGQIVIQFEMTTISSIIA